MVVEEEGVVSGFWSFDAVEERLVEAMGFLDRMPQRFGKRTIAGDGPWGQIVRDIWGDGVAFDVAMAQAEEARAEALRNRAALTPAEVDRMNEALEWVTQHVPAKGRRDPLRRVVGVTVALMAREGGRADWIEIRRRGRFVSMPDALRKSYGRAIFGIAQRLNRCRGL